ncbi:mercuric reductase [Pelagophyceae sp. CCMP2097]|nr:mercuric reductase [Pelagophyceae sp. CCMP2097]
MPQSEAPQRGRVAVDSNGAPLTWKAHLSSPDAARRAATERALAETGIFPLDEHNASLLDAVMPLRWEDAAPNDGFVYDLIAVGSGAGGLISAKQSARRGARSALISAHLAGGDCLTAGCVPSKALIRCARAAREGRRAADFGVGASAGPVDFGAVMQRMRKLRAQIAPADAHVATTAVGADVYQGFGRFTGPNTIEVNGKILRFRKAVVATGGSPAVPNIPGLKETPFTTNNNLFNLTVLPPRMVVVGGGPVGLEMAQAFACMGSKVTVLLRSNVLLPKEDADAAAIVKAALVSDGVEFVYGVSFTEVEHTPAAGKAFPKISVVVKQGQVEKTFECEVLLVATGRKPNVQGLGLENAGVDFDLKTGVKIDDACRTSNADIYAVGDCCTPFQFTHVAGAMASAVVQNSLFGGNVKFSELLIPWCTFTEPEVAHVGLYERDFSALGLECDTYAATLAHVDRAILEGDDEGFVKIHCKKGTDEILGATIVAAHAGEMISELTLAIQAKVGLGFLGRVIHPYPTVAEAIQSCGVSYNRSQWLTLKDGKVERKRPTFKMPNLSAASVALGVAAGVAATLLLVKRR